MSLEHSPAHSWLWEAQLRVVKGVFSANGQSGFPNHSGASGPGLCDPGNMGPPHLGPRSSCLT